MTSDASFSGARGEQKLSATHRIRVMNRSAAGFTLFEMLIAVSVFAVMGVVAFGGLGQLTRHGEAVAGANERLSDVQFAVVYFARDWTQLSQRKIRDQYGDEAENLIIEDGIVTFTRSGWDNLLGQRRSNLQRVQYLVEDKKLLRRYWVTLDQQVGETPIETVLLEDVESLEVELLDADNRGIEIWPPQVTTEVRAPILLSMRLDLPDMGEITRLLEIPDGAF